MISKALVSAPACRVLAVLRPARDLDARDAAIVRSVWRKWVQGLPSTYWDIATETGLSAGGNIHGRVCGIWPNGFLRRGGGLIERGWLQGTSGISRSIRPGLRFGGLGSDGTIYELMRAT